jgi:hypothetical protein
MAEEALEDIEVVRRVYDAMASRDLGRIVALFDPSCTITQDPALPWGGHHVGHDGFATFGLTISSTIESAVTIEAMFVAAGEVIQFGRTRGTVRATGAPFDLPEVHRWTIRDGRVVAAVFAIDTAAMLEALAAPGPTDEAT